MLQKKYRNIVLIGFRGSGKTSVAIEIGKKLNLQVISSDEEIVKNVGSINEYVENNGWDSFRKIEAKIISSIKGKNKVIDCGGGAVEVNENINHLKKNGILFWLKASVPTIVERIKDSNQRPSLTEKSFTEEVGEVLGKRMPLYKKAADYEICTDNKSIEEISSQIIKIINAEL